MRRTGFAVVSLLLASACGSTVQVSGSRLAAGDGTTVAGSNADGVATGTTGADGGTPASEGQQLPAAGTGGLVSTGGQQGTGSEAATGAVTPSGSLPTTSTTSAVANTRPLLVGLLNTGSNAALAAGFGKKGTTATWEGSDQALVRWFNKHGGIAGRQIKTVTYTVNATSTSYSTDVQAACAKFTQDYKVDVVLTTAGTGSFDSLESCLSKAHVVNLEAYDQGSTDEGTFAKYPSLFTVGSPSIDHALTGTLRGLTGSGYLSAKNKVGVIVEACPYNVRAFERTYAPLAKKLGLTVTRRDTTCVDGAADLGSFAQQISTSVLPFRSAGIDRVGFVSDFESLGVLAFSDQAESQGWRPGYALTSAAHTGAYQPQLNAQQVPQMIGVGNLPNVDMTSRGKPTGDVARCRSILASEGITGSASGDFSIMDTACDVFWLLEEGLKKSRGNTAGSALQSALAGIGTTHRSASVLGGGTSYDAAHRDGAPLSAIFAYQAACNCVRYTTKPTRF